MYTYRHADLYTFDVSVFHYVTPQIISGYWCNTTSSLSALRYLLRHIASSSTRNGSDNFWIHIPVGTSMAAIHILILQVRNN